MKSYQPGLHLLATFTAPVEQLTAMQACEAFFTRIIQQLSLTSVGSVYHSFEGAGFTAVVCLTESHISIHTWPEYQCATFDVFLSNHERNNEDKVRELYQLTLQYFNGTVAQFTELNR